MKTKFLMLMLTVAIFLPLTAYSEDTKKADTAGDQKSDSKSLDMDQVLANYYNAIGGLEKWRKLDTMIMKGERSSLGTTIPVIAYHARPNKCRVEFILKDTMMAQIFSGQIAWQINPLSGNPEPAPMTTGRANYMRDTCGIDNSLIDYKNKDHEVKFLGAEEIEGKKNYKFSVKYKSGNVETYYIDAQTFLMSRSIGIYNMDGNVVRTTTNFMDYNNTDGYIVPYKLITEIHGAPGKETLKISEFVFNSKIDPGIFEFPKDKIIKMQKKK